MGTQVVRHTSRVSDFILNFSATENNLQWAFTSDGDGAIFDVVLTNIASFSVGGVIQTAPYNYPLVCGSSYFVSIIKTTTGQSASITIKTRRVDNKTTSINVPDYGLYNRRYPFQLRTGNIIDKLDFQLLHSSNYTGNGTFTTTPILNSITLPTAAIPWQYHSWYVDRFGVEKVMVVSSSNTNQSVNVCIVDVVTMSVTDLNGNSNTFTNIVFGSTAGVWNINGHCFDYINNKIIFKQGVGGNSAAVQYDIINNSITLFSNLTFDYPRRLILSNQITRINPTLGYFCHHNTDFNWLLNRSFNYTFPSGSATVSFFNRRDGYKYVRRPGDVRNIGEQAAIDNYGAVIKSISTAGVTGQNGYMSYSYINDQYMAVSGSSTQMQYVLRSTQTANVNLYGITQNIAAGDTYLKEPYCSGVNEVWAAFGNIAKTRLYLFDRNQTPASYGYLDFASAILCLTVTGYEE